MFQKIIIVGNLGRDPEMRYTPSGQAVTNFSVATNRQYTDSSGQRVKETTWFRVSAWGRQAETCNQYLRRGSKVLVEGRMNVDGETGGPRVWTDQNGNVRASFEITATSIQFLSTRQEDEAFNRSSGGSGGGGYDYEPPNNNSIGEDDDIPF